MKNEYVFGWDDPRKDIKLIESIVKDRKGTVGQLVDEYRSIKRGSKHEDN